jgi:hypothetical protein
MVGRALGVRNLPEVLVRPSLSPSSPRKRGSMSTFAARGKWIPACAGMTTCREVRGAPPPMRYFAPHAPRAGAASTEAP